MSGGVQTCRRILTQTAAMKTDLLNARSKLHSSFHVPLPLLPTPSTLHLAPYTLDSTPYSLHPTPYTRGRRAESLRARQ
eukprot:3936297-Rhodomonas_salina.4